MKQNINWILIFCVLSLVGLFAYVCVRSGGECAACQHDHSLSQLNAFSSIQVEALQGKWQQVPGGNFILGEATVEGTAVSVRYQNGVDDEVIALDFEVQRVEGGKLCSSETDSGIRYGIFEDAGKDVLHFEVRTGSYGYRELRLDRVSAPATADQGMDE